MEIPERLQQILKTDAELNGCVMLTLSQFVPWLQVSTVPFFPEYTDHGPMHIEAVLRTADSIIADDSRTTVSAGDAAVLILAVLMHDIAMHLTEDGFMALVTSDSKPILYSEKTWQILWQDFMSEARRFDGRKLQNLFGDTVPVKKLPSSPDDFSRRDRILIGEFLRRHHARLAHEIAIKSVPITAAPGLGFQSVPKDIADIVGLVARSHGFPIRESLEYLSRYDLREYKGIHAVFLMALLRVSDYLQVNSQRAPSQALQVRRLRSPVSQGEWKAHHAIRDIRNTDEDPEAIFIDATPKDVSTFLRVKSWLIGIQSELDQSWATLGEIYGRFQELNLKLMLRRVRSNLDNHSIFAKTVPYVPEHVSFATAGADLINLLVAPLYGDRPDVAVRELLQNAIDAVLELKEYSKERKIDSELNHNNGAWDVIIKFERSPDEGVSLIIEDKGMGMTADVIKNYFLKAGATFRKSEAWRRSFENSSGTSRITRSGRFGVGALASFLLGDKIHVSTRHFEEPTDRGIEFSASIETESIELRYVTRSIGTTIRVPLRKEAENALVHRPREWDWYCLKSPLVVRSDLKTDSILAQQFVVPDENSKLPRGWHRINHSNYSDIQWTYGDAPALTCNGIKIYNSEPNHSFRDLSTDGRMAIKTPKISIFDKNGKLPLNLQRSALRGEHFEFKQELLNSVSSDIAAHALMHAPGDGLWEVDFLGRYFSARHPAFASSVVGPGLGAEWMSTKWGVAPASPVSLINLGCRSLAFIPVISGGTANGIESMESAFPREICELADATIAFKGIGASEMLNFGVFQNISASINPSIARFGNVEVSGWRILIPRKILDSTSIANDVRIEILKAREIYSTPEWILLESGDCTDWNVEIESLANSLRENFRDSKRGARTFFVCWFLQDKQESEVSTLYDRIFADIIGSSSLPYRLSERMLKFAEVFERLQGFVEGWRI